MPLYVSHFELGVGDMERRASARKLVEVSVYLSDTGYRVAHCKASDISDAGVYLKTNPLYLPRDRRLNLTFALHLKSSNIVRLRRLTAVVTHTEDDGVGLKFCANRRA
ncbi:MAG TPA: PilZ domain-containing protein [Gammaproteobacteria bacterium]|nr:PilZ domain-containing protein [Gammaproteobacteria bacterium]